MRKISLYNPILGKNEKKNVLNCLNENWISSKGKYIELFERKFRSFTKINYCSSVVNGTAGLHLCLLALNIKDGDEIIVPTFTYIASVNCITYVGAKPIFVDSDYDNMQISINDIEKKINKKTKAIIIPHLYGYTCDLDLIKKIKKKYKLYLIEDCAEALGSFYKKKHVGNFGDICSFSFFGSKTISTGEGGMVCSNSKKLILKVKKLKGQGLNITKNKKYYWHDIVGYNYRMTNICASIGLAQMNKINNILKRKKKIFNLYKRQLSHNNIIFPSVVQGLSCSHWLIVIFLNSKSTKNKLAKLLTKNKIETRPTFYPAHTMKMYTSNKSFNNASRLSANGICLPSYPNLNNSSIIKICNIIKKFFKKN